MLINLRNLVNGYFIATRMVVVSILLSLSSSLTFAADIKSITTTQEGTFNSNHRVLFTAEFSTSVTPKILEQGEVSALVLQLDSGLGYAPLLSHDGSTITFAFNPSSSDFDFDGIAAIDFFQLNFMDGETETAASLAQKVSFPNIKIDHSNATKMPLPGIYLVGDELVFELKWNKVGAVNVVGSPPILEIELGDNQYLLQGTASGQGVLQFTHIVTPDDQFITDINILQITHSGALMAVSDASIDDGGTEHILTISNQAFRANPADTIQVGLSDAPSAVSINAPREEQVSAGETLDFEIVFTGNVTVEGIPTLELRYGEQTLTANYIQGSGTHKLLFRLTLDTDIINAGDIAVVAIHDNDATFIADGGASVSTNLDNLLNQGGLTEVITLQTSTNIYINGTFEVNIITASDIQLTNDNIAIENGELIELTGVAGQYVARISPTTEGEVTFNIVNLTNFNIADNQFSLTRAFDQTAPSLLSNIPLDGQVDVDSLTQTFTLEFSENIVIPTNMASHISLLADTTSAIAVLAETVSVNGATLQFEFTNSLAPAAQYQLAINGNLITDQAGNSLDNAELTFAFATSNHNPDSVSDTFAILEDETSLLNILSNDSDSENQLDLTSISIVKQPEHGALIIDNAQGIVTYTPKANYFGEDSFSYNIADQQGARSNSAQVAITIQSVNDLPQVVLAQPIQPILASQVFTQPISAIDADGDAVTIELLSGPNWLNLVEGQLTGTATTEDNVSVVIALHDGTVSQQVTLDFAADDATVITASWNRAVALVNQSVTLNLDYQSANETQSESTITIPSHLYIVGHSENCQLNNTLLSCLHSGQSAQSDLTLLSTVAGDIGLTVNSSDSVQPLQLDINVATQTTATATRNLSLPSNSNVIEIAELASQHAGAEIVVASTANQPVTVLSLQDGSAIGTINSFGEVVALLTGDFNQDSTTDVIVINRTGAASALYQNNGLGQFTVPQAKQTFGLLDGAQTADLNSDGHLDIVTFNGVSMVSYINDGNGVFDVDTNNQLSQAIVGVLPSTNTGNGNVLVQSGQSIQTVSQRSLTTKGVNAAAITNQYSFEQAVIDFALYQDQLSNNETLVVLTNAAEQQSTIKLLSYQSDGSLQLQDEFGLAQPKSMKLADFNQDGLTDILVHNANGSTLLYTRDNTEVLSFSTDNQVLSGQFDQLFAIDDNSDTWVDVAASDMDDTLHLFTASAAGQFINQSSPDLALSTDQDTLLFDSDNASQLITVEITNQSEQIADGIMVNVAANPQQWSVNSEQGFCTTNDNSTTCFVDTLAAQQTKTLALVVNNLEMTEGSVVITVSTVTEDANQADNARTLSLRVTSSDPNIDDNSNEPNQVQQPSANVTASSGSGGAMSHNVLLALLLLSLSLLRRRIAKKPRN